MCIKRKCAHKFILWAHRLDFGGGGGIWTRVHQRRTRASPGASTIACSWPASYSWPC